MFTNTKKGFTLIELLVVIAIIGILSSVVLASLNTARSKGSEAKVAAQLSGARAAAEIYYSNNGTYGTLDNSTACNSAVYSDSNSGMSQYTDLNNYPSSTVLLCDSNGTNYALRAAYNGKYFCVDSAGVSTTSTTAMAIDGDSNCDINNT